MILALNHLLQLNGNNIGLKKPLPLFELKMITFVIQTNSSVRP